MMAVLSNHLAIVKALLGAGALVDLKNKVSPAWTAERPARPVWYGWGSGGPIVEERWRICLSGEKAQKAKALVMLGGARRCALLFLGRQGVLRVLCGAACAFIFLTSRRRGGCARVISASCPCRVA